MNKKVYTILLAITALVSCHKNDGNTQIFTKDSYPLAVGNWWQYEILYCIGGYSADTFTLSIVSMTNAGPNHYYACNFIGANSSSIAGNFIQSDTSLSFSNASANSYYTFFPDFHFKFPASTGSKWPGNYPGDTIRLLGVVDSCGGFGHVYGPCYSTDESYNLPHNFLVKSMQLTPTIGINSQSIDYKSDTAEIYGVNICQSIHLLNYHIQ